MDRDSSALLTIWLQARSNTSVWTPGGLRGAGDRVRPHGLGAEPAGAASHRLPRTTTARARRHPVLVRCDPAGTDLRPSGLAAARRAMGIPACRGRPECGWIPGRAAGTVAGRLATLPPAPVARCWGGGARGACQFAVAVHGAGPD